MRSFNVRAALFLVAALVLAGLTGLVIYGATQRAEAKQPSAPVVPTISVVVAVADIPVRTQLTPDLLTLRSYPTELVPSGAIASIADATGRVTSSPIARGQAVVSAQLAATEGAHAATVTIEKGKVLVAFPTNDPLTQGGLVNVGDHVDVLASVTQGTGENAKVTQTTLQNLEVLDLITTTTKDASGKDVTTRPTALVFSVDHQVALVLKYLRDNQALIDITVRSRAEGEFAKTSPVDLGALVSTYGFR